MSLTTSSGTDLPLETEVLVIGAGVSGLGMLHPLVGRGIAALCVDFADGVGGTWFWNRYPGCRLDSESYSYGYFSSPELLQEWDWSEHFASQTENEAYFNHVADRFDLRSRLHLGICVESMAWDPEAGSWPVTTSRGVVTARFVVSAVGALSRPQFPAVPGLDTFAGPLLHTARWPATPVDLRNKRVAVIGTGSSGVQLVETIAEEVSELLVLQRTPNWCAPLNNAARGEELTRIKASYDDIWRSCQNDSGFVHNPPDESAHDVSAEQRQELYSRLYDEGRGWSKLYANYREVRQDSRLNREFTDFLAARIRARVHDPVVAEQLVPDGLPYGVKRPPMENGYYETFNLPHVSLVDMRTEPLVEVTPTGLTTTRSHYETDVIISATGFDAITGAFDAIEIRGRDGMGLRDRWSDGPVTYLGLATEGFPNLFYVGGPQSLSGNSARGIEKQVDYLAGLLELASASNCHSVESGPAECDQWVEHVNETIAASIYADVDSWAFGSNTSGKKRTFGLYSGGLVNYGRRLEESASAGYAGFVLA